MASNIRIGQEIRVTIRFVDFDQINGTDDLLAPDTVTGAIYKYNTVTGVYDLQGTLTPIVNDSLGIYHYDWTTTADGKYRLLFVGTFAGATPTVIENPRDFYVGTAEPTVTLGSTYEAMFLAELSPLYIDPEEIIPYYSEANLVEVTEIIYRLSVELQEWFTETVVVTSLMRQYLLAATLCQLTKIHTFDGGMNGFADLDKFVLGDLEVDNSGGTQIGSTKPNRGNVSNWCELADLLRTELLFSRTGLKSFVKGSNYTNPIPSRSLKRAE